MFWLFLLGLGLSLDELEFHHLNLDAEGHTFKQSSGKASTFKADFAHFPISNLITEAAVETSTKFLCSLSALTNLFKSIQEFGNNFQAAQICI